MLLAGIKFTESSRAVAKWAREDFLRMYLTIFFLTMLFIRLHLCNMVVDFPYMFAIYYSFIVWACLITYERIF